MIGIHTVQQASHSHVYHWLLHESTYCVIVAGSLGLRCNRSKMTQREVSSEMAKWAVGITNYDEHCNAFSRKNSLCLYKIWIRRLWIIERREISHDFNFEPLHLLRNGIFLLVSERVESNLNELCSSLSNWLMTKVSLVELTLIKCHWNPMMIIQHWFWTWLKCWSRSLSPWGVTRPPQCVNYSVTVIHDRFETWRSCDITIHWVIRW